MSESPPTETEPKREPYPSSRLFNGLLSGHALYCFNTAEYVPTPTSHVLSDAEKDARRQAYEDLSEAIYQTLCDLYADSEKHVHDGLRQFLKSWDTAMDRAITTIEDESDGARLDPRRLFIPRKVLDALCDDVFAKELKTACYPLIACKPRYFQRTEQKTAEKDTRSDAYFGIDVTHPRLFRDFLKRVLFDIVQVSDSPTAGDEAASVRVYVGLSRSYLPLPYVIAEEKIMAEIRACPVFERLKQLDAGRREAGLPEACVEAAALSCRNDLRFAFPSPDLIDIDDQLVDGSFKYRRIERSRYRLSPHPIQANKRDMDAALSRLHDYAHEETFRDYAETHWRETELKNVADAYLASPYAKAATREGEVGGAREISKPLAYFRAIRVDYSIARLDHYTGGLGRHVGEVVYFTNYHFYMEAFLKELLRDYVRPGHGSVYLSRGFDAYGATGQKRRGRPRKVMRVDGAPAADPDAAEFDIIDVETLFTDDPDQPFHEAKIADLLRFNCQMGAINYAPNAYKTGDLPKTTMMNIGVGPSNAKTATDLIAAVRPLAWLMLGHCGGLRMSQEIGQYVLAADYLRDDHCLDRTIRPDTPIQAITLVQRCLLQAIEDQLLRELTQGYAEGADDAVISALRTLTKQRAVAEKRLARLGLAIDHASALEPDGVRGFDDPDPAAADPQPRKPLGAYESERERFRAAQKFWRDEFRRRVRVGTVITTDDRNWELRAYDEIIDWVEASRAVAIDMESGTIAANGLRYRIPYGALLCVSDKPLVGEGKTRGMASQFYETATKTHVKIGLETAKLLRAKSRELRASRQLHGLDDPPFA